MKAFTAARTVDTPDEIWLLEHPPVYTYGVAGREAHLPRSETGIPVIHVDRGGQVTYHGPGQLVAYALIDLRRRGTSVRALVQALEQAVIDLLLDFQIASQRRENAPGVYVAEAKVAALGLRIRRGCSYHGLSLNVDMDLRPFRAIDPCGYPDLQVTQLRDLGIAESLEQLGKQLVSKLEGRLAPAKEHA
jgi:lipoyl(octanoyl) transferase